MSWLSENGAGLIGTAVSGVSGVINNIFNRSNMKKQHEYNVDMLNRQNDYNTTMWNLNNEYNSPSAQRDRLVEAGLNPINVGNLQGNTATAASSGSGSGVGLPSSTMDLQNPALIQAQIDNIKADTAKKNSEGALTNEQKKYQQMMNDIQSSTLDITKKDELYKKLLSWSELTEKLKVASNNPEVIMNGYKDTWQKMSQDMVNGYFDYILKEDEFNNLRPQQKEKLLQEANKLSTEAAAIPVQLALTRRGQDIDKYKADLAASVQKFCKNLDVVIAQIAKEGNIEVARINAGFSKILVDMLNPVFDFGKGKVAQIVKLLESGKGLSEAIEIVMGIGHGKSWAEKLFGKEYADNLKEGIKNGEVM